MKETDNKEIAQIRFEFTDGTWFILDQHSLRHLKTETKLEVDFSLSKVFEEIESKRIKNEEENTIRGYNLGIDTGEDVGTRDVGPGQN